MPRNKNIEDDLLDSITGDDEEDQPIDLEDEDLSNEDLISESNRLDGLDDDIDDAPVEEEKVAERRPTLSLKDNKASSGKDTAAVSDFEPRAFYKEDAHRNLVDEKGKVIARAGAERGLFQRMRDELVKSDKEGMKLARRLVEGAGMLQKVWKMYKDLQNQKSYAETQGINQDELKQIVDLAVLSKANPIAAAKKHLTILHMNGIDISSLGTPGAVDATTIANELKAHVDKRLNATNAPDPAIDPADVIAKAKEEVYTLFDEFPAAIPYAKFIGEVKSRYPNWTLKQCWEELDRTMRIQAATAPVVPARRQAPPPKPNHSSNRRSVDRRMRTDSDDAIMSFDQIAAEVLRDAKALE